MAPTPKGPQVQIHNQQINRDDYGTFNSDDFPDHISEEEFSPIQTPTPAPTAITTRAGRVIRQPREYWRIESLPQPLQITQGNNESDEDEILMVREEDEPETYAQAMRSPESDKWKIATEEELNALNRNNTWDIVDKPANRKIMDNRWVFRIKRNADGSIERYKARLVVKGFQQVPGTDFDETFSPVVRYDSHRLLIAIAATKQWIPQQLDIKSAFLYGNLKEEIYMYLPQGYRLTGKVCRLKKALYGLKQAHRE
jgi:hypothetical protein